MAGIDLKDILTRERLRTEGGKFLAWWLGELKAMVGALAWRPWERWQTTLLLERQGNGLVASCLRGGAVKVLGRLALDAAPDGLLKTAQAIRAEAGTGRIVLRFGPADGLQRIVQLPAAAKDKLRRILSFEMDRLTPWTAEAVYYGADIVARQDEQIKIRLSVLPRSVVDPLINALIRLRLAPGEIVLDAGPGQPPGRVERADVAGSVRTRRLGWLIGGLLLLDWAGGGLLHMVELHRREALHVGLEAARHQAEAAMTLRDEVDRLTDREAYLSRLRHDQAPAVYLVDLLSRALPDNAWLYELHLSQKEAVLSGYAKDASALVPLIEQTRIFGDAKFMAPVVHDPGLDADRFQIGATVRSRPGEAK